MRITMRPGHGLHRPVANPVTFANKGLPIQVLQDLAKQAHVRYLSTRGLRPQADVLFPVVDKWTKEEEHQLTGDAYDQSQAVAVVGPVLVVYDGDRNHPQQWFALPDLDLPPIQCVSIPAINFAYNNYDRAQFVTKVNGKQSIVEEAASQRMYEITHLFLTAFQDTGVKYPVLCAIGCGAFKGGFTRLVPRLWSRAMAQCLKDRNYGFALVVISVPVFGKDDTNAKEFHATFDGRHDLPVKVVITEEKGMVTVARKFAEAGLHSGILNPSDAWAVRGGYIRMYWDGGDIALEEILAQQTTLLLQHWGVNPQLYTDPSRWRPVPLPPAKHRTL